jgi:Lon protease-like protein
VTEHSVLPLFPLSTVLFPRGPLPLRIFETRYTDMVKRCMRESSCFGVVLLREGREAGAATSFCEVGTSARIVDFNLLPDGLLGISCQGERRFRVRRAWREADGLNMGEVEWLEVSPGQATDQNSVISVPETYRHLADLLRKVLPELGEIYAGLEGRFEDAEWVSARLTEILPISLEDKQYCLELDDPLRRLELISPLIRRAEDLPEA